MYRTGPEIAQARSRGGRILAAHPEGRRVNGERLSDSVIPSRQRRNLPQNTLNQMTVL